MANIIIVGAGVAGLSAGIYAQMNGHTATIYERHGRSGGNLTGWNRNGYHIDNCIHWLTGTNPSSNLYRTWTDLGVLGDVPVYQAEALYTFEKDGQRLSLWKDLDRVEAEMLRISPADREEIRSFIKAVKTIRRMNGVDGAAHNEKGSRLGNLVSAPSLLKYYRLSTGELARRFSHPLLQGFIGSFITEHFSSVALLVVFATFTGENGGIPMGASCAMAQRMTERFISLGGRLRVGVGVARIHTEGRRARSVTLDNGETVTGDYIIITSDPATVFGGLLPSHDMPPQLQRLYANPRLRRFSSLHCAFSCDTTDLPFCGDLIFEVSEGERDAIGGSYLVVREFSHEKGFAPNGKSIIQTMMYCSEETALRLIELSGDREAYREWKRRMAADVEDVLLRHFPQWEGKLSCLDVWTPATYHRYVGSQMGSYMSFIFPPRTLPRKVSGRIRGLDNVLLASQWLQAPGGLPIAARAGMDAIGRINLQSRRGAL